MAPVWRVLDRCPVHSLDDYVAGGGGTGARLARSSSPEEVIGVVHASGLRGRGGAGFPTGTKWETVAASQSSRIETTVVVNAAEGEPGTFKDRALLRTNPYRVVEGALVAAFAMRTDRIRIGIKATFGREIDRLRGAISEMRAAGWLDGVDIELVLGPSSYLFGEETALLEVLEGRQPFPGSHPPTGAASRTTTRVQQQASTSRQSAGRTSHPPLSTTSRPWRTSHSSSNTARTGSASSERNDHRARSSARSAERPDAAVSAKFPWARRCAR
jgi:NADH:ubiquinone oxidoreductase subunit F (NADH-binding)